MAVSVIAVIKLHPVSLGSYWTNLDTSFSKSIELTATVSFPESIKGWIHLTKPRVIDGTVSLRTEISLEPFEASGYGGGIASVHLRRLRSDGSGLVELKAIASIHLHGIDIGIVHTGGVLKKHIPAMDVEAFGTFPIVAIATIHLKCPDIVGEGISNIACNFEGHISWPRLVAAAKFPIIGRFAGHLQSIDLEGITKYPDIITGMIHLPILDVEGNGRVGISGQVIIHLPILDLNSHIAGKVIIHSKYGEEEVDNMAVVMTLDDWGVTEYLNYYFNSFAKLGQQYLGANENGIYLLEGSDDAGVDIDIRVITSMNDYGDGHLKLPWNMYLGIDSNEDISIYVHLDNGEIITLSPEDIELFPDTIKVKLSRRIRSRYWAIELRNSNGGNLELDQINLVLELLNRRTKSIYGTRGLGIISFPIFDIDVKASVA